MTAFKPVRTEIPASERGTVFLVNRVAGLVVHYGPAEEPICRIGWPPIGPMFTSWFGADVTCKRCLKALDMPSEGKGKWATVPTEKEATK